MVCDAFTCTPLEALQQPYSLTMSILGLRSYAKAKEAMDTADGGELPDHPMIDLVAETQLAIMREAREAQRG